ncbi:hypothetical protein O181_021064 [Austropuccinia psidii MF-1]|uniref:Ty3 transposon capsid-like protein domain-containing protein n=1 Tax=Austropuccinia psidii MF-1 TaxID=1389203 RepID=A0A9Q3CA36_9BASI|nr:hypothetical protein [Austropuccinia psidii MF-1]
MLIQQSPPERQTRSQERAQAVLTPTPRAPLDSTPAVPQLRAQFGRRSTIQEGRKRAKRIKFFFRSTNYSDYGQDSEASRTPAFNTPSVKAAECFDGTQPFKVTSFIQYCQLIFYNDLENFSQDRKKVLHATSTLIGRAAKWIEPYLCNLTNQDQSYLLHSWNFFESQLFTLFGDPNEVRKAEAELDSLTMEEGGHVSLYIADFRSLVSRIGVWIERALIHHFRKVLPYRLLNKLAFHPSRLDSLQDLMDITLELDSRYHERQKGKSHHQEKKPEASRSNSSHPQDYSRSSQKKKKNFQKRDKPHSSLLNKDF